MSLARPFDGFVRHVRGKQLLAGNAQVLSAIIAEDCSSVILKPAPVSVELLTLRAGRSQFDGIRHFFQNR